MSVDVDEPRSLTDDEIADLLTRTSRTFALAIPCLPPELSRQIGVAYLMFRIIDSVEDGNRLGASLKCRMLARFSEVLGDTRASRPLAAQLADFVETEPSHDEDECLLHRLSASVVTTAQSFRPDVRRIIFTAVRRSAAGMSRFVLAGEKEGAVRLQSGPELHEYCFCVAGVVGEMLTQLFVEDDRALQPMNDPLLIHSPAFGEALQLVNILRDSDSDGQQQRQFIPPDTSRSELMWIASRNLDRAEHYIELLKSGSADAGVIQFTEIPVRLARETLIEVERHGPGARVSRSVVMQILESVTSASSPVALPSSASGGRS